MFRKILGSLIIVGGIACIGYSVSIERGVGRPNGHVNTNDKLFYAVGGMALVLAGLCSLPYKRKEDNKD